VRRRVVSRRHSADGARTARRIHRSNPRGSEKAANLSGPRSHQRRRTVADADEDAMKPTAFDAFADGYDASLDDPWRRRFADGSAFFIDQKCRAMVREMENGGSRPMALDVGCGQGRAVAFLSDRWRTVGTDVSREMLCRAEGGLRLAVQEPFALPFC